MSVSPQTHVSNAPLKVMVLGDGALGGELVLWVLSLGMGVVPFSGAERAKFSFSSFHLRTQEKELETDLTRTQVC